MSLQEIFVHILKEIFEHISGNLYLYLYMYNSLQMLTNNIILKHRQFYIFLEFSSFYRSRKL